MGLLVILLAVSLIGAGVSGVLVTGEYVPLMVESVKPIGITYDSSLENYKEKINVVVETFPILNNIRYDIYTSTEDKYSIHGNYYIKLTEDGYNREYDSSASVEGIPVKYSGYVKGLTGIGVITTPSENFDVGGQTVVIYTIGALWEYQAIVDWYNGLDKQEVDSILN